MKLIKDSGWHPIIHDWFVSPDGSIRLGLHPLIIGLRNNDHPDSGYTRLENWRAERRVTTNSDPECFARWGEAFRRIDDFRVAAQIAILLNTLKGDEPVPIMRQCHFCGAAETLALCAQQPGEISQAMMNCYSKLRSWMNALQPPSKGPRQNEKFSSLRFTKSVCDRDRITPVPLPERTYT